jgi:glycosyltransferase involved in cell wall biosynthesis
VSGGPRVSVCVATVRADQLDALIRSIRSQTYDSWELVLVTQGPDPDAFAAVQRIAADDPRVRVAHLAKMNRSNALNEAMRIARGDIIAFTDDDCEAAPNWLEEIVRCFDARPQVGLVGGELAVAPNRKWWTVSTCPSAHAIEAVYHPSERGYEAPHGLYILGANTAMRREVTEAIGPFDVTLGPGTPFPSCEDLDYGVRAEALDVVIMTTARVLVHHSGGRRYGWKAFLSHHRNYARGRGAYVAKLRMGRHRLGEVWSQRPTKRQRVAAALRNPPRFALNHVFYEHHARRAAREYAAGYYLDDSVGRPVAERDLSAAGGDVGKASALVG